MAWKEYCIAGALSLNVAACPMLESVVEKDHIHEQINSQSGMEQSIELPNHLRREATADISKSINDFTEGILEAKEKREKTKEALENAKDPPLFKTSPPDKLNQLEKEKDSIDMELKEKALHPIRLNSLSSALSSS